MPRMTLDQVFKDDENSPSPLLDHEAEIVTRSAPRWAWNIIDQTLELDANAKNFDTAPRDEIGLAYQAMIDSCEAGN